MSLSIASRAYVLTHNGMPEIQLCVGDITQLPLEDKVDVIMVSACTDSYPLIGRSVVAALYKTFGLDVQQLAENKKEDLRTKFHCWLSHRLPDNLPYRQLLCYETIGRPNSKKVLENVQEVFRAMMPAFNNSNKSVITSLLGTNAQKAKPKEMLQMIMITAVKWMRMGLPLQLLKIVVYTRKKEPLDVMSQECLDIFQTYKDKIESLRVNLRDPKIDTDIFLVSCEKDRQVAKKVKQQLKKGKMKLRIKSIGIVGVRPDTWQHQVYSAMLASSRVVPLLSENFIQDSTCVDQYNIALCCNRRAHRNIMAPLMLENSNLPAYMNIVQWLDCRGRSDAKIKKACATLLDQVALNSATNKLQYDVFVSYCHRNSDTAAKFVECFQNTDPELRIFFDSNELKTGVAWQQALYKAIDSAPCMVALLSPEYVASAVCKEEFHLALAKHLSQDRDMELVAVQVQPVDPGFHTEAIQTLAMQNGDDQFVTDLCRSIIRCHKTGEKDRTFSQVQKPLYHRQTSLQQRENWFHQFYDFEDGQIHVNLMKNSAPRFDTIQPGEQSGHMPAPATGESQHTVALSGDNSCLDLEVLFSYILSDQKYLHMVVGLLQKDMPKLKSLLKKQTVEDRLCFIERAKCFVVLLSSQYILSRKEMEEFNVILSKMRSAKAQRKMYVVWLDDLPRRPTYCHLVPCDTALSDPMWENMTRDAPVVDKASNSVFDASVHAVRTQIAKDYGPLSDAEVIALLKVAGDLNTLLVKNSVLPYHSPKDCLFDNVVRENQTLPPVCQDAIELKEKTLHKMLSESIITTEEKPEEPNETEMLSEFLTATGQLITLDIHDGAYDSDEETNSPTEKNTTSQTCTVL